MKVTKYGHSCLLVKEGNAHILIDPGKWNKLPDPEHINVLLITHEHPDHFDPEQVQALILKHPQARVITHESVGQKLKELGIVHELIEPGQSVEVEGVSIESHGTEHAPIHGGNSPCRNTGYLIASKLFAPGDAFSEFPEQPIEILALPTGGLWVKFSEALEYATRVKPKVVFPIHDAVYDEWFRSGRLAQLSSEVLNSANIQFIDLPAGSSHDF